MPPKDHGPMIYGTLDYGNTAWSLRSPRENSETHAHQLIEVDGHMGGTAHWRLPPTLCFMIRSVTRIIPNRVSQIASLHHGYIETPPSSLA